MAGKPKQSKPPRQMLADAKAVDGFLKQHFERVSNEPAPRLLEAMSYAVLNGGKRFRGALTLGASRLASHESDIEPNTDGGLMVAAAIECMHAYSLIHDDLPAMDNAETRRGKPACHIAFDEATAILAGDALQTLAFKLIADPDTHEDPEVRNMMVLDLAWCSGDAGMVGGQMMDLEAEKQPLGLEGTSTMQSMKTGQLINAAVRCGGLAGDAHERMMDGLHEYAIRVGYAFQIADDILDRTADSKTIGKPTGRDEKAGKATLVDLVGIEEARAAAESKIDEAMAHIVKATDFPSPEAEYLLELASFCINRGH